MEPAQPTGETHVLPRSWAPFSPRLLNSFGETVKQYLGEGAVINIPKVDPTGIA
jgi:hypothetical protein